MRITFFYRIYGTRKMVYTALYNIFKSRLKISCPNEAYYTTDLLRTYKYTLVHFLTPNWNMVCYKVPVIVCLSVCLWPHTCSSGTGALISRRFFAWKMMFARWFWTLLQPFQGSTAHNTLPKILGIFAAEPSVSANQFYFRRHQARLQAWFDLRDLMMIYIR